MQAKETCSMSRILIALCVLGLTSSSAHAQSSPFFQEVRTTAGWVFTPGGAVGGVWDSGVQTGGDSAAEDLVQKFVVLANPRAGAKVFLDLYPETAPRGASQEEAIKSVLFAAQRRIPLYKPPYPNTKMGFIREEELKLDATFLGVDIKDVKPLFTNDLIDEINDFDRSKIVDQAKSYKV
jgi:hypothetical protein